MYVDNSRYNRGVYFGWSMFLWNIGLGIGENEFEEKGKKYVCTYMCVLSSVIVAAV